MREPIVLCWSGGKDSVLALDRLHADPAYEVVGLLTTVAAGDRRVQMHGVPVGLLQAQCAAIDLPLVLCEVPEFPSNRVYESGFAQALARFQSLGVRSVAFGDLFLADIRAFREAVCQRVGVKPVFPVWGESTKALARGFLARGHRAVTCCVDRRVLSAAFAGREYDADFLGELPAAVDPCGENGEFHTFVFDGPLFGSPVDFARGEIVLREPFWYCELHHEPVAPARASSLSTLRAPLLALRAH